MKIFVFCLIVFIVFGFTGKAFSAPYNGEPFDLEQPDGSTVPVIVWGDEFYQHIESPDGFTLVRNSVTGWICYAQLSTDSSELTATDSVYRYSSGLKKSTSDKSAPGGLEKHIKISRSHQLRHHEKVRSYFQVADQDADEATTPSPAPSQNGESSIIFPLQGVTPINGNFTGLTILIDFSDKTGAMPVDSIKSFVNNRGYTGYANNGSVRDYFYDVSGGKVDYQNIVVGYYRAKNAKTYYDNSSSSFGLKAQELLKEAITDLRNKNFDFTRLSSDNRKQIYAVNVMYAGSPAMGWSQGLWPHQGSVSSLSVSGLTITKYQMSNIGTSLNIGTFCHENGHLLFRWPDLYDYGSESNGVGNYCVMCGTNAKNPVRPCAYLRDYSGWDIVTDITDMVTGTIFKVIPNSNTSFMYRNKNNSSEMFYIEGALRSGRSKTIADSGFMIWHVDRKGSNNYEQRMSTSHYLVSLEQADNLFDLELKKNMGNRGDLFKAGYKDRFDDQTAPAAKWWNGSTSGMKIFNMSKVADTMSFSIGDTNSVKRFQVTIRASEHGTVSPGGTIHVVAGGSLKLIIKPDSGYQVENISINGTSSTIRDTVTIANINSDQTVEVQFALKSSLLCLTPAEGELYFVGDIVPISWKRRGVTVQGIVLSFSDNNGKGYTSITDVVSDEDSSYQWNAMDVESDSCRIRIADRDGTPSTTSERFSIRKKPQLSINDQLMTFSVAKGRLTEKELPVKNNGTGDLVITATSVKQIKRVLINEISMGVSSQDPDAIELWNSGTDIDVSSWKVSWEDNKESSGSYTFKEGTIFKGGSTFSLFDLQNNVSTNSDYMGTNVMWRTNDFLELSVSITDQIGQGIDFVKTTGIPTSPPEGTSWEGNGIELCSAFVYRRNYTDTDSSRDWGCTQTGTLKQTNNSQQNSIGAPILTLSPLTQSINKNTALNYIVAVNATSLEPGTYSDTILFYHNDPTRQSPQKIPCKISVYDPTSVINKPIAMPAQKNAPIAIAHLSVIPNPAQIGQTVTIQYTPVGNEAYGELVVFNSMGSCLYHEKVNFKSIYIANGKSLPFSWTPKKGERETCLIRMNVTCKDGSKNMLSAKVGLR
ncbi:MAG TPA: M6 family metalloprotease domain-containing protein [Chitinispirillaceae bacterium]|nr:M6 family metalloprotease domain-containing protein [Chitinispirillaceae bacterium]